MSTIKQMAGMTWLGKILSEIPSSLAALSEVVWTNLLTHLHLIECQHAIQESFMAQRVDVAGSQS